ncbi:MAG TPA: PssE/Cps14G family polysaccharide biosynthesis glycosyltransferase [Clostridia bacterium]|nr:PssE/Cps14G family polysaccharide biosynthesis glycosyltransferase [Clostridia bacterium]
MIFVCLGTQEFQFDRLLKKLDELAARGVIKDEIVAQTGYSTYKPLRFRYEKFLNFDEFDDLLEKSSLVITHGGTGTIIKALRRGKRVIAVPRMKKYGEHVDDHQREIIAVFSEKNLIMGLDDTEQLEEALSRVGGFTPERFVSGNSKIISILMEFISSCR